MLHQIPRVKEQITEQIKSLLAANSKKGKKMAATLTQHSLVHTVVERILIRQNPNLISNTKQALEEQNRQQQ